MQMSPNKTVYENVFLFSLATVFSSCYYEKVRPIWRQQFLYFLNVFSKRVKSMQLTFLLNNLTTIEPTNDRPRCFQSLKWLFFRSVSALKSWRHFVFVVLCDKLHTEIHTHKTRNSNEREWILSTFAWKLSKLSQKVYTVGFCESRQRPLDSLQLFSISTVVVVVVSFLSGVETTEKK